MKKITIILLMFILALFSCKHFLKDSDKGNLRIVNTSKKVIEFIWIAPEGELYPVSKNISISEGSSYEVEGLEAGLYDIAIDFQSEYNTFNSKKDKNLCLYIEKGITKVWIVNSSGEIIRN